MITEGQSTFYQGNMGRERKNIESRETIVNMIGMAESASVSEIHRGQGAARVQPSMEDAPFLARNGHPGRDTDLILRQSESPTRSRNKDRGSRIGSTFSSHE